MQTLPSGGIFAETPGKMARDMLAYFPFRRKQDP
jgi:hypothetical protein